MKSNKTALITGATSGIGTVMAEHLVKSGYSTIILGRSQEKMTTLIQSLKAINAEVTIRGIQCDFSSLASTAKACEAVKKDFEQIDVMLLNAGLWNSQLRESQDGIEETLHVNLISQVQVFQALYALLPKNNSSKVIVTSSALHQGEIYFDDLEFRKDFSGFKAYRQSKLGLMLWVRWLANQEIHEGISFYCVHPGMVSTNLGRDAGWFAKGFFKLFGKSVKKGAQTHIHLIDQEAASLVNGEYYANKKVTKTTAYSYDIEVAERLQKKVMQYLK